MSFPHAILACATCMPDQSTHTAAAANMSILFLLGVILAMLGVFLKVIFNLARRQRQFLNSSP